MSTAYSEYSEEELQQQFRNTPSSVDSENKRRWIFPKKPSGKWYNYRLIFGYTLLGIFILLPLIQVNGRPFMLINLLDRKFIFFGQVYWPQDFFIILIGGLTFFVSIILFTAVYGRVFCGWSCPQTILMELVFRKIEYFFEGDYRQQQKLAAMPWNAEKIRKKGLKHAFFVFVSIFMAHVVMAYLISLDGVIDLVTSSPTENLAAFFGLLAFSAIFYAVFAYVREIVCTVICPYGRLQGVLLNKDSMIVAYDYIRGEPRGKIKKNEAQAEKGDCIDCHLCVHVCPTGIDIRNGTQLECVNCTACIDACNEVMVKIDKPKGLIRFDSQNGIEKKEAFKFTGRVAAYTGVLVIMLGLFGFFSTTRTSLEMTVMRVPGQLYQKKANDIVSNLYNVQIVNKTFEDKTVTLKLGDGLKGATLETVGGEVIKIPAEGSVEVVFFVDTKSDNIEDMHTKISVEVIEDGQVVTAEKSSFLGPSKKSKN